MNTSNPGILYIVATPLGNLQDITFRALEILKTVDYIAAEDTRHSAPLLQHFSILTPVVSLYEHNEKVKTQKIIADLILGKSVALVSDAGTPLISDPGYYLVAEARKQQIKVVPIPGPCAAIAALSAAGLPSTRFAFEGFLPAKTKARCDQLADLKFETRTLIFYEAPHRVLEALNDMVKVLGSERQAVLARELTKIYETIYAGTLHELVSFVANDANQQRGEIVLLVAGAEEVKSEPAQKTLEILLEELPLKQAVELAAKITGQRKNELYDLALKMRYS